MFVFLLALQASVQIKATVSDYGNLRTMLWLSIILLPIFTALWVIALLAVNDAIDELHYAYSCLALASSLYIFVGYCLVNRRVRHNIQLTWQRITIGPHSPGSDESFSPTRTSVMGSRGALYHTSPAHAGQQGSNFDVYGMRSAMAMDPTGLAGQVISSSSTTSRSTVTKGSGDILDGEESVDTVDETEDTEGYRHRQHRHHKCRRRHRRGHHRSKQSVTATDSDDRSMELASSHSSDEEDEEPGQVQEPRLIHNPLNQELMQQHQENQINSIIAQHQQQSLYGHTTGYPLHGTPSSTLPQANSSDTSGANTVIYGQRTLGGIPAVLTQNPENPNQAHLVTTMPFSRSNILAMTAGTLLNEAAGGPGSATGGANTPSPAPPMTSGMSPASSVNSHIYQSAHSMEAKPQLPVTTTEHIYSYARKPIISMASSQPPLHAQPQSTIYSTIGSKSAIISDDIGLPPISQSAAYRAIVHGPLSHHHGLMGSGTYQAFTPKENPYGITPAIGSANAVLPFVRGTGLSSPVVSGSHVRLLNPFDSEANISTGTAPETVDNSRNEANESKVSGSGEYLLLGSNPNTDSSNG